MSNSRRATVVLMAGVAFASACGGSAPDSVFGETQQGEPQTASPGALPVDGPIVDESVELARRFVERLGGDDVATDALLIGAELGYSGPQLLTGVEEGSLQADGTIPEIAPAGPPLGRIELADSTPQSARMATPLRRSSADILTVDAGTKAFEGVDNSGNDSGDDKIVLEQLRESAAQSGAFRFEQQQILGLHGVNLILVMLRLGLTPEQVIEGLVLGEYFYEELGVCYTQQLSVGKKEPEVRECSNDGVDEDLVSSTQVAASSESAVAEPVTGAQFVGSLDGVLLDDPESAITVTISPDGAVSGQLTATEQLDNYIASVSLCGIMGEEPDECGDTIDNCPATVLWSSDLSTLQFTGTPPDSGTVTGTIVIVWDTTPDGCGEPSTDTTTFDIEATVSPAGATITSPLTIEMPRVELDN